MMVILSSRDFLFIFVSYAAALSLLCDAVEDCPSVEGGACSKELTFRVLGDVKARMKIKDKMFNWNVDLSRGVKSMRLQEDEVCAAIVKSYPDITGMLGCQRAFQKESEEFSQLIRAQNLGFDEGALNDYSFMEQSDWIGSLPAAQLPSADDLEPGDVHYRAFVGNPAVYGELGSQQFMLLALLGLHDTWSIVEIGCGSLRLGRLLIPFLEKNKYFCLEPAVWLVANALRYELGSEIVKVKSPVFFATSNFSVPPHAYVPEPDIVVAQSIFSHTGPDLLRDALRNLRDGLLKSENTVLLATFVIAGRNKLGALAASQATGWVYPDCVKYKEAELDKVFSDIRIRSALVEFPHRFQTWFAIGKNEAAVNAAASRVAHVQLQLGQVVGHKR